MTKLNVQFLRLREKKREPPRDDQSGEYSERHPAQHTNPTRQTSANIVVERIKGVNVSASSRQVDYEGTIQRKPQPSQNSQFDNVIET